MEVTLANDFPCPGCGAELKWKPGAGSMACPYCGTTAYAEATEAAGEIKEYALDDAALQAPKGYGTETRTVRCNACGAVHDLEPDVTSTQCPFCGSDHIESQQSDDSVIRPESVLPFAFEKNEAVRQFRGWISGLWFRPNALKQAAQLESIAGVYIPAWTFDARADSQWTAEAGHYYYEDEEYTVEENGQQVTKTRQVRKTRWEPADGDHHGAYDDWLVQASKALDQSALKGLLPYELAKLQAYGPQFLAGFRAERYHVDLQAAWDIAQTELHGQEKSACRALVPGDTQRNLQVDTSFSDVTFKHTLLPVWVAAYRYQGEAYRYLVNGQTGKATGDAPYSWIKITLFVLAILTAIAMCLFGGSIIGAIGAAVGTNM